MEGGEVEVFQVRKLTIEPEVSAIDEEIELQVDFNVSQTLDTVKWTVTYIFDSTGKRHAMKLFECSEGTTYAPGEHCKFSVKTPKLDLTAVPRKTLLNVGLLRVEASQAGVQVMSLNMVVHVSKDKTDDTKLQKTILNPLE